MKNGSQRTAKEKDKFSNMTLIEINAEIARCLNGSINGGTTAGRKSFFKRLVWLEKIREENYQITAKKRDFRKHG